MALSDDDLSFIRVMIAEPTEQNGWTDEKINTVALGAVQSDGSVDLRSLAASIWEAKAADAVSMVDVSESGSSRSMGQVHTHALRMAERYRAPASGPDPAALGNRPQSTKIVRATRGA